MYDNFVTVFIIQLKWKWLVNDFWKHVSFDYYCYYVIIVLEKERVGNNMNTLTYRCLADHLTYVMTCKDDSLDAYMRMLFDEDLDVYKVNLNDELEFTSYADYELWKNEK